jgi:hypothetical protein
MLADLSDNTLIQISRIRRLERPLKGEFGLLRNWLGRPDGGDLFLEGVEANGNSILRKA